MFHVKNLDGLAAGIGQTSENVDCAIVLIDAKRKKTFFSSQNLI